MFQLLSSKDIKSIRPHVGFTLFELLFSIAIFSLLSFIVYPEMANWFLKVRIDSQLVSLNRALSLAKNEAVTQNAYTVIEPEQGNWGNGWRVYLDKDNDKTFSSADVLLEEHVEKMDRFSLSWSVKTLRYYGFSPKGYPSGTSAITARFCPDEPKLEKLAKAIIISRLGRTRVVEGENAGCYS